MTLTYVDLHEAIDLEISSKRRFMPQWAEWAKTAKEQGIGDDAVTYLEKAHADEVRRLAALERIRELVSAACERGDEL